MATPIVGVDRKFWVRGETAMDVAAAFVAGDAVALMDLTLEPELEYHRTKERIGTASLQNEVRGKTRGKWSASGYVQTNAAGIPPDVHEILRAGFGRMEADLTVLAFGNGVGDTVGVTVNDTLVTLTEGVEFSNGVDNDATATSIAAAVAAVAGVADATATGAVVTAYSDTGSIQLTSGDATAWTPTRVGFALRGEGHAPITLQLGVRSGPSYMEVANGAWVEKLDFELGGNDEPKFSASGGYATHSYVHGDALTNGALHSGGASTISLAAGEGGKIYGKPFVYFERQNDGTLEDNGGAGYRVSTVNQTAGTFTVTPALAGALSADTWIVRPVAPAHTTSGEIQGGVDGGLSIAGTDLGFISSKLTLNTGIHGLEKEGHTDRANRVARGERSVEGELEFYFLDENAGALGEAWSGTIQSVVTRAGPDEAGRRCLLTAPAARLEVSKIDIPEAEEATRSAKYKPRQSTVAEDELRIELT